MICYKYVMYNKYVIDATPGIVFDYQLSNQDIGEIYPRI